MKVSKSTVTVPVERIVVENEVKETYHLDLSRDEMMAIVALIGCIPRSREIIAKTKFYEGYGSFVNEDVTPPDMSKVSVNTIYTELTRALNVHLYLKSRIDVVLGDNGDY